MTKIITSEDPTLNTDDKFRYLYLAVDWETLSLKPIGTCTNYQHARKRAENLGLGDPHPIGTWLAACDDSEELFKLGAEEVALVLVHPVTHESYVPYPKDQWTTSSGKPIVGLRKFDPNK